MLIQVLFSLQTMSTDCHAVVRCIDNVGIVQLSCLSQLLQHLADLDVDIFAACEFSPQFVTDGSLVSIFPDTADSDFVPKIWMPVMEGVLS